MKRIIILMAASLISVSLSAQTWGFTQFEMKVNDGNHDLILEAFEEQVKNNVKITNGATFLEMISGHTDE